ncbi:cation:proton antiporter domain-containing protein [Flavitalea flava]
MDFHKVKVVPAGFNNPDNFPTVIPGYLTVICQKRLFLLYDAAFNISFKEFRTIINTISTLAISLVFITASGIAVIAHYLIPGMTWPLTFVLGSILSATDAVAAMSITKGLGLSHKTNTILEGESLVNDASALVACRFAVAAVTGSAPESCTKKLPGYDQLNAVDVTNASLAGRAFEVKILFAKAMPVLGCALYSPSDFFLF